MSNYFISLNRNAALKTGIIHDPSTKLKVKVVNLLKSKFVPKKGEVSFFVTAGNETLAFETKGYKRHRELLILHMVAWYCLYLGLMEAQIHSTLPSLYH
ncbi:hypothetical protein [Mucilaginibacter sp.]